MSSGRLPQSEREPWETAHKKEPSCQAWRLVDRVAAARSARRANRSTMTLLPRPGARFRRTWWSAPRGARDLRRGLRRIVQVAGPLCRLTAVNGDAWRAQRPLVAKALGGAPSRTSRAAAVAVAVDMMAQLRGTVDAREVGPMLGTAAWRASSPRWSAAGTRR